MLNTALLTGKLFSAGQIASICILVIVAVLLIALNVFLFIFFRKRGERKLCTSQLQDKREELLKRLEDMRNGEYEYPEEEESEAAIAADEEEEDEDEDEEETTSALPEIGNMEVLEKDGDDLLDAEILTIAKLSYASREKLGMLDEEYDKKRYYVRYRLGFEAKLRASSDEIQQRYIELMNELALYKGVKVRSSYKQQRIYRGRTTLGVIRFSGKTLCVAFALDPAEYAETKYKGQDKSDVKSYEKTPMVMRLTSARRLEYAKYLLVQLADLNTIVMEENPQTAEYDLSELSREELFLANLVRITFLGEVPDSVPWEELPELIAGVATADAVEDPEIAEEDAADEDEEDDDDETAGAFIIKGNENRIRYNRSYTARLIQANDELKARYSELKNYILQYTKVRNRVSWRREAFYFGRECFVAFTVRGKTLCMFLSDNAERFVGTKYKVENLTEKRPNAKMPALYRIRSDRSTKFAKQIIDILLTERGGEKGDYKPVDYRPTYKSTDNLINSGYIKVR